MLKYCSDAKFKQMLHNLSVYNFSEEDVEFDKYLDWLTDIAEKNTLCYSNWSSDNVDFDAVAFPETVKYLEHLTCWSPQTLAEIPAGATWLDIWKICDKLVYDSGDIDHRFIETFDIDGDTVRVFFGS